MKSVHSPWVTSPNFKRYFTVDFPTKAMWKTGGMLQGYDTLFFTDESKNGVEVFSDTHSVAESYGLKDLSVYSKCKCHRYWKSTDAWAWPEAKGPMQERSDCPVLARAKLQTLDKPSLRDLREISSFRIAELLSSVKATSWLWRSESAGLYPLALTTAAMVLGVCGTKASPYYANWASRSGYWYLSTYL